MTIQELSIKGCWIQSLTTFEDSRGKFYEWFQDSTFEENLNEKFKLAQANCSISHRGVLRGIHFTSQKPGQSKFVTVFNGKVLDVVVDLRKSSPTFGSWETVFIDSSEPKTIYIPWGVGHGFLSLENNTIFTYLCDARYNPKNEFGLNAFDPELAIQWPKELNFIQSEKDAMAPNLSNLIDVLPD